MTAEIHELSQPVTFDDFRRIYPRKKGVNWALARAIWDKITSPEGFETVNVERESGQRFTVHLQATPEQIVAGTKEFVASITNRGSGRYPWNDPDYGNLLVEQRFIPLPTTFLNQGRWMDD